MKSENKTIKHLSNKLERLSYRSAKFEELKAQQERAEEALRETDERYHVMFEQAVDSIVLIDPETFEFIDFNKSAYETLGYTSEDFSKLKLTDIIRTMSNEEIVESAKVIFSKEGHSFQTRHSTKSGELRDVQVNIRVVSIGGKRYLQSVWRDITEQKRFEKALKESEERFRAQYKNIPVPTYTWKEKDGQFVIVDYNDAAELMGKNRDTALLGMTADEMFGKKSEIIEDISESLNKKSSSVHRGPCWLRTLEESRFIVISYAFVPPDLVTTNVVDITEPMRAKEKLREYSERLEDMVEERTKELRDVQEELVQKEKLAILGKLAGGVGHELRNPLGSIKNAAYFLNMVLRNEELEIKESLDIIEQEVAASERIISSLLDYARQKPPAKRSIFINDVIHKAFTNIYIPSDVVLDMQLDKSLISIPADPTQLAQVFENLIVNAVHSIPDSGKIAVKSEVNGADKVQVSFSDTGTGIPEEDLKEIFEPLYTSKARGIGLGLAVAKTIIEGHGGTIEVTSEVGKGSTFVILLPIGREADDLYQDIKAQDDWTEVGFKTSRSTSTG